MKVQSWNVGSSIRFSWIQGSNDVTRVCFAALLFLRADCALSQAHPGVGRRLWCFRRPPAYGANPEGNSAWLYPCIPSRSPDVCCDWPDLCLMLMESYRLGPAPGNKTNRYVLCVLNFHYRRPALLLNCLTYNPDLPAVWSCAKVQESLGASCKGEIPTS